MFYSQTFLARKGPLGTVWCAAHLQHRLKRSHYTSTDISSAIDRIMFPEVPIALRMSGHLLLGVVRIYSKKVEYLFHDCNVLCTTLRKAFTIVRAPLPDDPRQSSSFEDITIPDRVNLDALEVQEETYDERNQNNHLTTIDEITIQDRVPPNQGGTYATATFDEDIIMAEAPQKVAAPVEAAKPLTEKGDAETVLPGEEQSAMPTPDVPEIIRDAHREIGLVENPFVGFGDEENRRGNTIEEFPSPEMSLKSAAIEAPSSVVTRSRARKSLTSLAAAAAAATTSTTVTMTTDLHMNLPLTPELAVIQSPPPVERGKKRNMPFDRITVLSNKHMKMTVDNARGLVRERRQVPSSSLELWELNNVIRKDHVFQQCSFTGFPAEILNVKESERSAKSSSSPEAGDHVNGVREEAEEEEYSPPPPPSAAVASGGGDEGSERMRVTRSMLRKNEVSPSSTVDNNEAMRTPKSGVTSLSAITTPGLGDTPMFGSSSSAAFRGGLPDIPEMSAAEYAAGELYFLDEEDHDRLHQQQPSSSSRTIALAQYLENQSPVTPAAASSKRLSLNKILKGRSRKLCARMFFETLVMTSLGLIDVQQDEPYSDIQLHLSSSKAAAAAAAAAQF